MHCSQKLYDSWIDSVDPSQVDDILRIVRSPAMSDWVLSDPDLLKKEECLLQVTKIFHFLFSVVNDSKATLIDICLQVTVAKPATYKNWRLGHYQGNDPEFRLLPSRLMQYFDRLSRQQKAVSDLKIKLKSPLIQ